MQVVCTLYSSTAKTSAVTLIFLLCDFDNNNASFQWKKIGNYSSILAIPWLAEEEVVGTLG